MNEKTLTYLFYNLKILKSINSSMLKSYSSSFRLNHLYLKPHKKTYNDLLELKDSLENAFDESFITLFKNLSENKKEMIFSGLEMESYQQSFFHLGFEYRLQLSEIENDQKDLRFSILKDHDSCFMLELKDKRKDAFDLFFPMHQLSIEKGAANFRFKDIEPPESDKINRAFKMSQKLISNNKKDLVEAMELFKNFILIKHEKLLDKKRSEELEKEKSLLDYQKNLENY